LKEFVDRYNNTFSRSIGNKPENIFSNSPSVFRVIEGDEVSKIDLVFSRRSKRKVNKFN